MKYRFKNRGFSSFEILIYIGLIGVFCSFILPILSSTQKINSSILTRTIENSNEEIIVDAIEELIENGCEKNIVVDNLSLPHNAYVFNYSKNLAEIVGLSLDKEFFNSISSTGNVLLVKSFKFENGKVRRYITLLQFHKESKFRQKLILWEGEHLVDGVGRTHNYTLLDNVTGEFTKKKNGIFIKLKVLDRYGKERRVLYGYENFSYRGKN